MSVNDFFGMMRLNAAIRDRANNGSATYGELTVYDPQTHTGKFKLPLHRDLTSDEPVETGWIPIETPFHGMQFPPPQPGVQARVHFLDVEGLHPISATLMYNQTDAVPYPAGDTWGWRDPNGNEVKGTKDGWVLSSPSGFNAEVTEQGKKLKLITPGGLEICLSDNTGTISIGGEELPVSSDGVLRISDMVNILNAQATLLKTWANANFQGGTNSAPAPSVPSVTGSSKVASG